MNVKKLILAMIIMVTTFSSTVYAAEFEMVSYSAHVKLQWLAAAEIPEAQMFLKKLGKNNHFNKDNLEDFERIEKVNSVYQELCYTSVNNYIKENNYKNVFDIACSYSPRVLGIVKDGGKYVAAELSAVSFVADQLVRGSLDKKFYNNFSYEDVLVEDEEATLNASGKLGKNVCIVENGLMIYLTKDRAEKMFRNVKRVLEIHGGCFITSDFSLQNYFKQTASALYGDNNAQTLYNETKTMYENVLEDEFYEDTFKSEEEAIKFLDSLGFKVEQVPLFSEEPKLYSYNHLNEQQIQGINKVATQKFLWVITLKN